MTLELLPHHASLLFRQFSFEKDPKKMANTLGFDEAHRLALERNLTEIWDHRQDEPIVMRAGQNDIICEGCPGQNGPYYLQGWGMTKSKCDLTLDSVLKEEQENAQKIRELTGKEQPTPREIYQASCKQWKTFIDKLSHQTG